MSTELSTKDYNAENRFKNTKYNLNLVKIGTIASYVKIPGEMFTPLYTRHINYTQLTGKKSECFKIMEKYNNNLLEMDVDRLFQEHHINDILVIKKMFDAEIERKRIELRTMVSEKYKDILTASDAIATMKDMSQKILDGIQDIHSDCDKLIDTPRQEHSTPVKDIEPDDLEERTIVMQIRLTMALNEQIWLGLDEQDFSRAAQFYLLAQHVHTGLRLLKKDITENVPFLKRIKGNLEMLRSRILNSVKEKMETLELTTEETSSNLNALMLLENQSSSELLNTFIDLRKNALKTVIVQTHSSVRNQLSAMVRCLVTTIHLLHDCFISYNGVENGLIWQQLEEIVNEDAAPTLSKMVLPHTPLVIYIPEIIKQFRPKCCYVISKQWQSDLDSALKDWLRFTSDTISTGLSSTLEVVTSIKGLYIIREEALKIAVPENWDVICSQMNLPKNFNVWYYFFQELITNRAKNLLSKKVSDNVETLQEDIVKVLDKIAKAEKSEADLRWYAWNEDADDISKSENVHIGLAMKTKGYSPNIITLCEEIDSKYLNILIDTSMYLYGKEYSSTQFSFNFAVKPPKHDRKYADREKLEEHLTIECSKYSKKFAEFLLKYLNANEDHSFVLKSLMCARFVQALTVLCPNFKKCVCLNGNEEWEKICEYFSKTSLDFWMNWVDEVTKKTEEYSSQLFSNIDIVKMLFIFQKWDSIEIQEQTDENTFKSQIKVPHQLSFPLQETLTYLSDSLSCILPHTLPKKVHSQFMARNIFAILVQYEKLLECELTQKQALQYLFDVKFLTVFCVARENMKLVQKSQEICDRLRGNVDPFDLDVFYSYLQGNVKQCCLQSQVILGCLLPTSSQLINLGSIEKNKEHEKEPSILPLSQPSTTSWFPLLPVTAPMQKTTTAAVLQPKDTKNSPKTKSAKKVSDTANTVRSGAAALFGAMTTDWFSNK